MRQKNQNNWFIVNSKSRISILFKERKSFLIIGFIISSLLISNNTFSTAVDLQNRKGIDNNLTIFTADGTNPFISIWNTSLTNSNSSASNQIQLPLMEMGTYNFLIDWGDESTDHIISANYTNAIHSYSSEGEYTLNITGIINGWMFNSTGDHLKLLEIQQWGCLQLGNSGAYFFGCYNLICNAVDNLNLTGTTNLMGMFAGCNNLGDNGNMDGWDVSSVTNMVVMFAGATTFDQPIGTWNVSSVLNMTAMFHSANMFNQSIGTWDVSNVIDMTAMFYSANMFNQPIGTWNVSLVTQMTAMFYEAKSFDQYIGSWNVSNVFSMGNMFFNATDFNQPLGSWNISQVSWMGDFIVGTSITSENYDHLLNGWAQLNLHENIIFDVETLKYTANATVARQYIIDTFNWIFLDGGLEIILLPPVLEEISSPSNTGNIELIWNEVEYATYYEVYRATVEIINISGMVSLTTVFTPTYLDENLVNRTYYYVIVACDTSLKSNISNCRSVTVEIPPPIIYEVKSFISVWDTTKYELDPSNQITLPLAFSGTYNFTVDWGDGSINHIVNTNYTDATHTYSIYGNHTVNITGKIQGWRFNNDGDDIKLVEVKQWGCLQLGNYGNYFEGCRNLVITASDSLNLTGTTNMNDAFMYCRNIGSTGNLNNWDVSDVVSMRYLFSDATSFNQPLDSWNVSNVEIMMGMFQSTSFNQDINNWDVSEVINMIEMFYHATSYNQPLNNWDVSNVEIMMGMFGKATSFNQDINIWDVSSVINMIYMFEGATNYNHPLNNWDVSNVNDMEDMFRDATSFNQPLDNWVVSSVTNMRSMFRNTPNFNQSLASWNVSSVIIMDYMFEDAICFDQPLGTWNIINVEYMYKMFNGITLSPQNYDNLLIGWSQLDVDTHVIFHAGNSKYTSIASDARDILTDSKFWDIYDGGQFSIPNTPILDEITSPSTTGNITLSWNMVFDATSYKIYRAEEEICDVSLMIPIAIIINNSYEDIDLINGTYYYVIEAINYLGNSPISNCESVSVEISPSTGDESNPPLSTILEQISGPSSTGNIELNWSSVINATTYKIYRASDEINDVSELIPIFISPTSSYSDTGLSNGTYYYVIVASNDAGDSPISNCQSVSVEIPPSIGEESDPPLSTILEQISGPSSTGNIELNWSSVINATNYKIYRASDEINDVSELIPIFISPTSSYSDTGLSNGTYYYVIVASNDAGDSPISNCQSVSVEIPPSTGGDDDTEDETLTSDNGNGVDNNSSISGYSIGIIFLSFSIIYIKYKSEIKLHLNFY